MDFSDYIIYVDESGDHNLSNPDPNYPVFVLAFCIVHKADYYSHITPAIQRLKFEFFGHDMVILHDRDIRLRTGPFRILSDEATRLQFLDRMNEVVTAAPVTLICAGIKKTELVGKYAVPSNPYAIALQFCMERAYRFLKDKGQHNKRTHIVVEARGKKEDRDLELEFLRICQGRNYNGDTYPFELNLAEKKVNSGGLQLADLLARPVGTHILRPEQPNRAYEIVKTKFRQGNQGQIEGYGLKIFP